MLLAEVLYWRVVGEVHVKTSPFIEFGPRHVWLNEIKPFESEREEGEEGERGEERSKGEKRERGREKDGRVRGKEGGKK